MNELPNGWVSASIADTGQYINGLAFKPTDWKKSGTPIIRIKNLTDPTAPINRTSRVVPDSVKVTKGTILVSWSATLDAFIWNREDAVLNQHIFKVVPDEDVVSKSFLYFLLRAEIAVMRNSDHLHGSTMKHINRGPFLAHKIALPPLAEQKRIAEKLEAVLGRVDACRARLDRVPHLLKRFRQTVLAAATSGLLTEDWRKRNAANDEWENVEIGDLIVSKPRNGYSPRAVDYETPIKSLTLTATTSGRFRGEHSKFIDEEIPTSSHLWLEPGDILIQRANTIEYVGVSAIFDGPPKKFIYPDLMMKCRPNERTTTGFLHLLLQSEGVRRHFRENATGTAGNMPKINQGTVTSAPAVLPSLSEQQEIVRRVQVLFEMADRIEARLIAARAQVERLTPATLQKAFSGDLVPQDPNDEPASLLLDRVRIERAISAKTPRTKPANSLMTPMPNTPLIDLIKRHFGEEWFTFDKLQAKTDSHTYDELKDSFFALLRVPDGLKPALISRFNDKLETMEFSRLER